MAHFLALAVLTLLALAQCCPAAEPVAVRIDGRILSVNGQTEIPRGLFGAHSIRLSPEIIDDLGLECVRQIHHHAAAKAVAIDKDGNISDLYKRLSVVIDCAEDRYTAASVLTRPDFATYYYESGKQYGKKTKDANWPAIVEFWNEPYLNWAERSRKNYDVKYYDVSKAVEGGPVTIKGWDKPLDHLKWRRLWAQGEDGKIGWGIKLPPGAKPGDKFKAANKWYWTSRQAQTFTVVEQWNVYDADAESWYSGPQNFDFYMWMFEPWAKGVKETNPQALVIGGWCYGFHYDNWAVWRQLYQPMIDRTIKTIDGICEHHYHTDTRWVTVWNEVALAYTVGKYDKWIKVYNTECSGKNDPAVHGAEATPDPERVARDEINLIYTLRDILELCYRCPEKPGSRTAHQFPMDSGTAQALRLLKDLRGRLVRTASADGDIWPVAAANGDRLVVAVFNNARSEKELALTIDAPEGTTLGPGKAAWVEFHPMTQEPVLADAPLPAEGKQAVIRRKLGAQQAVKFVLPLAGAAPQRPQIARRQFFAGAILQRVIPQKPLDLQIAIDPAALDGADRATLRLVLEGVGKQTPAVTLNGRAVALPATAFTVDIPINPADLKPQNALAFTATAEGYQVNAASILVDR